MSIFIFQPKALIRPASSGGESCSCPDEYVCANENDLGIRYGSCYTLSFSDGTTLGRNRDDYYYVKNGYLQ